MLAYALIILAALAAVLLRKLTPAAGVAGAIVAACMHVGMGNAGIALLGAFFVLGTGATSWKGTWKKAQGLKEENGGRRRVAQVLANGGVAALAAAGAFLVEMRYVFGGQAPEPEGIFPVMAAAALSAATADTLASELGNVYGRKYFDIRRLRPGQRGADGVISFEGTAAGFAGSLVIATIYYTMLDASLPAAVTILIAGNFGNLLDSVLGATLQRAGRLTNDGVNFFNTLAAALLAGALQLI